MAMRAVHRQVGPHAGLHAVGLIGQGRQRTQGVKIRGRSGDREKARVVQGTNLVVHDATVIEIPVELRRAKAQDRAAQGRNVTSEAFGAARIVPHLRAQVTAVVDGEPLVQPAFGHKRGVGLRAVPSVGHAVRGRARVSDEETCLQSPPRFRDAVGQFHFEVLNPDRTSRKSPSGRRAISDGAVRRDVEPPAHDRVVRPGGQVDQVGEDAGLWGEGGGVAERAGVREGFGQRCSGKNHFGQSFDHSLDHVGVKQIAVRGIAPEGGHSGVREQLHPRSHIRSVVAQRPDVAAAVVA